MPETVSTMALKVQERFGDANTTQVIDYINRVHRELLGVIPELARYTADINLTSGTVSYDLNADTLEIALVLYITDATTATKLTRTSLDKLIQEEPTWTVAAAGTPTSFYIQGDISAARQSELKIFLYPKPDTTTSTGFPILRVFTTEAKTLQSGDNLPEGIATFDVYLEGASYYAAQALRGPAVAAPYLAEYERQKVICSNRFRLMLPQTPANRTYPIERK